MMTYYRAQKTRKFAFILCYAMLAVLLAIGGIDDLTSAAPVEAHFNGNTSIDRSSAHLLSIVRYQGKGYSFLYDSSWQATPDGNNGVKISHDGTRLDVLVQHTTTPINALQFEFGTQATDNCRQAGHIPPTAIIDEATWDLARYICASSVEGQSSEEIVTLDTRDAIAGTYYSMAVVAKHGAMDRHAFKSIASFRFD